MLTLTYAPGQVYSPLDVSGLLKRMHQWAERRGVLLLGLWVLELTKAGNPHYHILLWLPKGFTLPKPDKQGWWTKGHTRIEWARSPVGYIAKYSSKGTGGDIPSGARLWGAFGRSARVVARVSWAMAPKWLREFVEEGNRVIKQGCWWLDQVTGIRYRSPWVLDSFRHDGVVLRWVGWSSDDIEFTTGAYV